MVVGGGGGGILFFKASVNEPSNDLMEGQTIYCSLWRPSMLLNTVSARLPVDCPGRICVYAKHTVHLHPNTNPPIIVHTSDAEC